MTGKTHAALGILIGLGLMHIDPSFDKYTVFSGTIIGSLLPDLDTKKSTMSQILPAYSRIVDFGTKHRGATHKILPFVLLAGFAQSNYLPLLCLGLGSLSHWLIDAITRKIGATCGSNSEQVIYYCINLFSFVLFCGFWIDAQEIISAINNIK